MLLAMLQAAQLSRIVILRCVIDSLYAVPSGTNPGHVVDLGATSVYCRYRQMETTSIFTASRPWIVLDPDQHDFLSASWIVGCLQKYLSLRKL